MPGYGKKKVEKPRKHDIFRAKDYDNKPLIRDYTVKRPRQAIQTTPDVAVNRTNKGVKEANQSVHHKNTRHDPMPRLEGSDDLRAMNQYRLNRRRRKPQDI